MRRTPCSALSLFLVAAVAAAGTPGCNPKVIYQCDPPCATGQHCASEGCAWDEPPDLSITDMAHSACVPSCAAPQHCNAYGHCVDCIADGDCPSGHLCRALSDTQAQCVIGCDSDARCNPDGGAGAGRCCMGACVDTTYDNHNCGACGALCGAPHTTGTCTDGVCDPGRCVPGWADCNSDISDGCESNTHVDPDNCTTCGMACSFPGGVAACSDGCYLTGCQYGFDDCNGDPSDGCEKNIASDGQNCGACGHICANPANAHSGCQNALCAIQSCNVGYGDCDGQYGNGCETPLLSDNANCGACGKPCPVNEVCTQGACTCPMCNNAFPNASADCFGGMCFFKACNLGWGDCDGIQANGCETNVTADKNNCGKCGNVCPMATPVCTNGACTNIDLSGVFNQFNSGGRPVYVWKTPGQCVTLANYTNFCPGRGLSWWVPNSQADAQNVILTVAALDARPTWIQIYGLSASVNGSVGGYNVAVDGPGCVASSGGPNAWAAFRKWACSFCDPNQQQGQGCCWDKGNPYDWFVCM